jgi:hypothetical protein
MNKIRNVFAGSFVGGLCVGMFPTKVNIHVNNVRYGNIPMPLLGGFIGVAGLVASPILITNYVLDGAIFEQLFNQYHIDVVRYNRLIVTENNYVYSSIFNVYITDKPKS